MVVVDRRLGAVAFPGNFGPAIAAPVPLKASVRSPIRKGYVLILLFVGGFGAWASVAPLAGGAIAPGVISPNSSRRVVQHFEGGIIRDLRVHEGDIVTEGQRLLVLESVQPKSAYETLLAQKQSLLAQKARLDAEKSGAAVIDFPEELEAGGKLVAAAQSQQQIFDTRRSVLQVRKNMAKQRTDQLAEQIEGAKAQIDNLDIQISYIREEVAGKQALLDKGLLPKPEAMRLKRNESELLAQRTGFETDIAKTKQLIVEANLQVVSAEATRLDEIAADQDKVNNALIDIDERLSASKDVLKRTEITAPVAGTVINMRFKTVGGVVGRGDPILEIVPRDDKLIIEARVSPNDIPLVHQDQPAQIHLAAYSSRVMPRLRGIVRSVSADRVTDGNGMQSYYVARVEIDKDDLKARASEAVLLPGMSAEVIFVTEERTLLQFLLSPLTDILRRGMREH